METTGKKQATKKWIMQNYTCIMANYCELQHVLKDIEPTYYTAGYLGWNADVYLIDFEGEEVAIVTGARPFGDYEIPQMLSMPYEHMATVIIDDSRGIKEKDYGQELDKIRHDLIWATLGWNAIPAVAKYALNQLQGIDFWYRDAEWQSLKFCPGGNCSKAVDYRNQIVYLRSYDTVVAFYVMCSHLLYIRGLYSTTTRKHINAFLQEVAGIGSFVPFKKYVGDAIVNTKTKQFYKLQLDKSVLVRGK